MKRFFTHEPSATRALGQRVGEICVPGTVVALVGDLGTGKTVFAKGVGAGLAVPGRIVSPTFVVIQAHEGGRLPFWHADLYRLGEASDLEQLGLDEVLEGDGVVLVEWADRFPEALPNDRLEVRLEDHATGRCVSIIGFGPRHLALEADLG